jgi:tripeptide aminopeptidase
MDENGYIMAYVPSNISENEPTVGFIAHYDTSPDFNGENVKPQIWEDYKGVVSLSFKFSSVSSTICSKH